VRREEEIEKQFTGSAGGVVEMGSRKVDNATTESTASSKLRPSVEKAKLAPGQSFDV
jgi:hypothetical protein